MKNKDWKRVRNAVKLAKDIFTVADIMEIANIDDPTGQLKQLVLSNLLSRKDLDRVYMQKTYYFKKGAEADKLPFTER